MSLERKNTDFGTRPAAMTVAPRTGLMSGAPASMAPGRAIEMQERAAPVRQQPQPVSVGEVVPYLLRRATENADAMSGAPAQRAMMLRELGRRLFEGASGSGQ